jgi:hypothetical protein
MELVAFGRPQAQPRKLAALSNIAQDVGTLRNELSGFILMELAFC